MSIRQRITSWLIAISISAGVLVVGCSKPEIACGTVVKPKNATDFELQLIAIARAESEKVCTQVEGARCDFSVYRTKSGWTVQASPSFPYEGRCITRIGGERYYAFDEVGKLVDVINGF
ncbi:MULTISPECIES: hypothetical protein [unclassified Stenotrophomonas]|jgi:hypothetical protein|uniref:hypothetical protein n=1 Tax=Stenotrophomonas TaxID=40323 RepID=UPI003012C894